MGQTRIYFDKPKRRWIDCPTKEWKEWEKETGNLTINLHVMLRKKLDNIKKIVKKKWDAVFIIDGGERSGKSTLGMTAAWYLSNGKLTLNNFAAGIQDAAEKVEKLPDGSILFVDEGSLVFNSKDSMTKEAKKLQKVLDVVGQKNMTFIIILPCIFDLNKNIATRRSKFLLHVYTPSSMERGRFCYFGGNKKRHLYILGKKNFGSYAKPKSDWLGNFDDFQLPFNEEYLVLKRKSLAEALGGDDKGDGKIRVGLLRAVYVQRVTAYLEGKIPKTNIANAFGISSAVYYRDLEVDIPPEIENMNGNKRIKMAPDNLIEK